MVTGLVVHPPTGIDAYQGGTEVEFRLVVVLFLSLLFSSDDCFQHLVELVGEEVVTGFRFVDGEALPALLLGQFLRVHIM